MSHHMRLDILLVNAMRDKLTSRHRALQKVCLLDYSPESCAFDVQWMHVQFVWACSHGPDSSALNVTQVVHVPSTHFTCASLCGVARGGITRAMWHYNCNIARGPSHGARLRQRTDKYVTAWMGR